MAKRNDPSEEDYQYDEEFDDSPSDTPQLSADEPPRSTFIQRLLNRKILVPAGVMALAFIIYQFLSRETHVLPEVALEQQQAHTLSNPTNHAAFTSVNNPIPVVTTAPAEGLQNQVETLAQLAQQNQTQVQQLQTNFQQTQSLLVQMDKQLSNLGGQVQNLDEKVTSGKAVSVKKARGSIEFYTIRAVLPGRAWLQTSRGGALTVKVGDRLPDYGEVQIIDSTQGVVITSLGNVIRYGDNDS